MAYPRFPGSPSRLLSWHGLGVLGMGRWPVVAEMYLYLPKGTSGGQSPTYHLGT